MYLPKRKKHFSVLFVSVNHSLCLFFLFFLCLLDPPPLPCSNFWSLTMKIDTNLSCSLTYKRWLLSIIFFFDKLDCLSKVVCMIHFWLDFNSFYYERMLKGSQSNQEEHLSVQCCFSLKGSTLSVIVIILGNGICNQGSIPGLCSLYFALC